MKLAMREGRRASQSVIPTIGTRTQNLHSNSLEPIERKTLSEFPKNYINPLSNPPISEEETSKLENPEEDTLENSTTPNLSITKPKNNHQNRYNLFLESLQQRNKQLKETKKKEKELKIQQAKRLKQDLGFVNISSKLYNPTISSLANEVISSEEEPADRLKTKQKPSYINSPLKPVTEKTPKTTAPIFQKAQDYIAKIAEKKYEENLKKQQAKEKAERDKKALREQILNRPKPEKKEECVESPKPQEKKVIFEETKVPPKVSDEKALQRLWQSPKKSSGPIITDMDFFKKRYKLEKKSKVFITSGGYKIVKKALEERSKNETDWFRNPQKESPCYDLLWTLSQKDIDWTNIQEHQICNHFKKSSAITTKAGLINSLKNSVWFNSIDTHSFFPKGFDLKQPEEIDDFILEFKLIFAESVLKKGVEGKNISSQELETAIKVSERRLVDLDDQLDTYENETNFLSDTEWFELSGEKIDDVKLKKLRFNLPKQKPTRKKKTIQKEPPNETELDKAEEILANLKQKFPEFSLNGSHNIWIVKPAGLSRGRGIACYSKLVSIMEHTSKEGNWVVEKYIENPLLILNKKFDIRQWVLVTSWNPVVIWYYEKCYCRFSVEDFSFTNIHDIYAHLTNNSVMKHSENFGAEESMWHSDEFAEFLLEKEGYNVWEEMIKPRMKDIVIWSVKSAEDMMNNRKNSFEIYGYDFMIDEDYVPWLIEINSSPDMHHSTPVTAELVTAFLEDCVKVVVDYNMGSKKKKVSTGDFSLIYREKFVVDRAENAMGLHLVCEGKAVKRN